jgi:cellulose synthase/poly-beta-1,6-N-acetylglucosamine synthase-like glycosyltransferase
MVISRHTAERQFTMLSLALTGAAAALLLWSTGKIAWSALQGQNFLRLLETSLFGALAGFLVYGNLCYQVARLGRLRRIREHKASSCSEDTHPLLGAEAPGLTILVPSYREEISVIRQTLLSAALQDYPNKRVVLLLDDPPAPKTRQDRAALWAARSLPFDLQTLLAFPYRSVTEAKSAFRSRQSTGGLALNEECVRLSECFRWTAEWFEVQAKQAPIESHADAWFVEHILTQPAQACREQSAQWSARRKQESDLSGSVIHQEIETAYAQLAARFEVEFDVFERKQYCNLSHEPNKAMNLNSFLGIMGKRVKPTLRKDGLYLQETSHRIGSRLIPDTPYVITLDADSLLRPHYASTLVRLMERPEHVRVAVAQTPYSAFPNAAGVLERTAGATTDIQYLVHQGFTGFGATFWVGANALLRKSALEDICTEEQEGAKLIRRYIQDRTVIEDTESTVDLLAKGWSLYNYAERLAYSATPPDFGSLVIQRARWANGGLIILPKLLTFLRRAPKQPRTIVQALLQIHYLTSLAFVPLSVLLLLSLPFSSELMTAWMPLAALPYFALYARDLQTVGYRPVRDLIRVYALNLLLVPVHLTGAITSVRQALAGTKIPFRRTPKVSGRTRTSGLDLALQLLMVSVSAALGLYYVSQTLWISGAFALANAALVLYGIKHFIGFAEMKQDLLLSAKETVGDPALSRATAHVHVWAASLARLLRPATLQILRVRFSPRHATWSILILLEALTPALAIGAGPWHNSIQQENQRPGTTAWILTNPAVHAEIEGYASAPSVNQGQTIRLYVNTTAPSYRLNIYRMGWYGGLGAREVLAASHYQGRQQPEPSRETDSGLIECRWEDPIELTIPGSTSQEESWPSGYYLAKLTAESTGKESYLLFVVREDARPSTYLVQSSVATFQAYNNWGGKSLYTFNSTGGQAFAVSLNRPYAVSSDLKAADSTGAGPFLRGWEYNMVRWLERSGYDVTYTTDLDVHEDAEALRSHRAFLAVGHDEYWTWAMRQHLETARDRGTHLAFFAANSGYWQIRLEPSRVNGQRNRTIVAYKERALTQDPLFLDRDPNNDHIVTTRWRSAPVNRPEAALVGGMYLEGTPEVDGDLVIENPFNWIVQNTGLERGTHLPGLLGYEVDGLADSSPQNIIVIARSPVGRTFASSTLYQASSGALVFNAGSMQWIWGLDDFRADPFDRPRMNPALQQMTRQLLDRLGRTPEPTLAHGQMP